MSTREQKITWRKGRQAGILVIGAILVLFPLLFHVYKVSVEPHGGGPVDVILAGDITARMAGHTIRKTEALLKSNTEISYALNACNTDNEVDVPRSESALTSDVMVIEVDDVTHCIPEGEERIVEGVAIRPIRFALNVNDSTGAPLSNSDRTRIWFAEIRLSQNSSVSDRLQTGLIPVLTAIGAGLISAVITRRLREPR